MKKSEELLQASSQEDNDIKSFALQCKALREARNERFVDAWLPLLSTRYDVVNRSNGSYSITTEEFGVVDYFPKVNKVLIRKANRWIKPGLSWIISNLTK